MVESPKGIFAISPGDRIAQLLILPSLHEHFEAQQQTRAEKGFGSTGVDLTFISLDLDQRPVLELKIDNKKILGLLDNGADKSIIAKKDWPLGWPIQTSPQALQGLGYAKTPEMSARQLSRKDDEGHSGTIQPYVLELPVSLWGRDLLKEMGFTLSNEYSAVSQDMMTRMGYHPGFGLGKFLQGNKEPIQVKQKLDKQGLGFS
ncbi:endogenous retrovirus group K member 7 Pro protein-like [Dipodomys spectabilis]|uniref:endogenous retrovirus group K member 7 Pro protein-like n=1 Tax=Dipodomys spectabilis TaxID=105255 RepID=UPI001C541731|nr:endogenous retrovirus group K member 7 Pro protein-like [Dipodomys spectabilis]